MLIRVSNLRLALDESEATLKDHVARALGMRGDELLRWRILRKSLDARQKDALHFVYSVEADCAGGSEGMARVFKDGRTRSSDKTSETNEKVEKNVMSASIAGDTVATTLTWWQR